MNRRKENDFIAAIENIGFLSVIIGFITSILFVHYIEVIYVIGIVMIITGGILINVIELSKKRIQE